MDLYSAFLTTAPFILLAISGGITFGPIPVAARHRARQVAWGWLANDLATVLIVVVGAVLSLFVLGEITPDNAIVRSTVVTAGALALLLLTLHISADVIRLYREDDQPEEPAET